ncbi:MAG: hypothetical protein HOV80_14055, partial [Polyangiaceae bacterium]|nr:hypothetical protein [Polyangiaceae bacterium]
MSSDKPGGRKTGITRREALHNLGAVAGAAAATPLIGCGDDTTGSGGGPQAPVGITHIVIVMMENRSYDHYFGARSLVEGKPGDGLSASMANLDTMGVSRAVYAETDFCVPDPPHGWDASRGQFAAGMNSGFVTEYEADHDGVLPYVMGYFQRPQLPVTWALADAYTICDR